MLHGFLPAVIDVDFQQQAFEAANLEARWRASDGTVAGHRGAGASGGYYRGELNGQWSISDGAA